MKPTPDSLGFTCSDRFFANLPVSEDGTVEDVESALMWGIGPDALHAQENNPSSLANLREPWIAYPAHNPPDLPLYLNLERPPFSKTTAVALTARIDGVSHWPSQYSSCSLGSSSELPSCPLLSSCQSRILRPKYKSLALGTAKRERQAYRHCRNSGIHPSKSGRVLGYLLGWRIEVSE